MATYDVLKSVKFVKKSSQAVSMSKSNIITFSGKMSKDKAYIPPAGSYKPEKCFSYISRPGMNKRV